MGLFEKKKKPLQQDLSGQPDRGLVCTMQLLMEQSCQRPAHSADILRKHLGDSAEVNEKPEGIFIAVKAYRTQFQGGSAPPLLMLTDCCETKPENIDQLTRSQMWDCADSEILLERCKFQVVATDMLAGGLERQERQELLLHYLDVLLELYPQTKAVFFQPSGKLMPVESLKNPGIPWEQRFVHSAVNVRFFRIDGTEDMLVDSLGMSLLGLPDLQYHFHGLNPDTVVNHAYNMLLYLVQTGAVIQNGDTIDGIAEDGSISQDVQWRCHQEDALIQPPRPVIDICAGDYASGERAC